MEATSLDLVLVYEYLRLRLQDADLKITSEQSGVGYQTLRYLKRTPGSMTNPADATKLIKHFLPHACMAGVPVAQLNKVA